MSPAQPRSRPAQHLEDASVAGEPVEQGMTGRSWRPRESVASCRAYRGGRPEPSTVCVCGRRPATRPCNAVKPAPRHAGQSPSELRDAREPPIGANALVNDVAWRTTRVRSMVGYPMS
jgi:hypothetical protein